MSNKPFITVMTATYNCAGDIEKCINSVQEQSFSEVEHVIVDGGSTDGTVEIIEKLAAGKNSRIGWWASESDSGIYNAWNKALPHIKGEWVIFQGADDFFHDSEAFSRVVDTLRNSPDDIRMVYGKLKSVDVAGNEIVVAGRGWKQDKFDFFHRAKPLPHTAIFQRREILTEHNGFDESYPISADFDFMCKELKEHEASFVDTFVSVHELRGVSVHPQTSFQAWLQTLRIIKNHSLPVAWSFKALRVIKALSFYAMWKVLPEKWSLGLIDKMRKFYWRKR